MSFLNPFLLLSLLAIAVPLLIHLINLRRPEKIKFPTLQFFEELRRTTIRRIKLKEYLLLALRMLAVLCLAIALARPFLPSSIFGDSGSQTYVLVLDNSPSMLQMNERGTWFANARETASEFISKSDAKNWFIVLPTHGSWSIPTAGTAPEALRLLSRIEPTEQAFRLPQHLKSIQQSLAVSAQQVQFYWFGDMQSTVLTDFSSQLTEPFPFPVNVVKSAGESSSNVAVSNLQVLSRIISERRPVQFKTTVTHFGETPFVNGFISLEVNGKVTGQYPVTLSPGSSKDFVFEWTPPDGNPAEVAARLEGDTWPFDNSRYLSLDMPSRKTLLVVSEKLAAGEEPFYEKALQISAKLNKTLDVKRIFPDQLTPEMLGESAVIILNGLKNPQSIPVELVLEHVQSGRALLFIPGNLSDQTAWNRFFRTFNVGSFEGFQGEFGSFKPLVAMKKPSADLPLIQDVFEIKAGRKLDLEMPSLFHYWTFKPSGFALNLLQAETGEPLLTEHRVGQGIMLVSAIGTEPGWSDFPANPFYPVFWYRVMQVMAHRESTSVREITLGKPLSAMLPFIETELELSGSNFKVKPTVSRTATGAKVEYDGLDWLPGIYRLSSPTKSIGISVNPDILESDFRSLSASDISATMNKIFSSTDVFDATNASPAERTQWMERTGRGQEIWRMFMFLGLLFLVAESVVSRLYKTEAAPS